MTWLRQGFGLGGFSPARLDLISDCLACKPTGTSALFVALPQHDRHPFASLDHHPIPPHVRIGWPRWTVVEQSPHLSPAPKYLGIFNSLVAPANGMGKPIIKDAF